MSDQLTEGLITRKLPRLSYSGKMNMQRLVLKVRSGGIWRHQDHQLGTSELEQGTEIGIITINNSLMGQMGIFLLFQSDLTGLQVPNISGQEL